MNKAITINHEDGRDVWAVQMFELPKHQYDTSIDIIDKEQEEAKLEAKIEVLKATKLLSLMSNKELSNQAAREARILIDLEADTEYVTLKANLASLTREIEILKARNKKYELDFKTVKDAIYYDFRTRELSSLKEVKESEVKRYSSEEQ